MSVYLGQNAAPSVPTESVLLKDSHPSVSCPVGMRVRVDGKFFSRGDHRLRIQGVTYGPFAPDAQGLQFPVAARLRADFDQMSANEVNAIRTYHVPPPELLEAADEAGKVVLIDVPWARHLCFLDSRRTQAEARSAVENAVRAGRDFPSVLPTASEMRSLRTLCAGMARGESNDSCRNWPMWRSRRIQKHSSRMRIIHRPSTLICRLWTLSRSTCTCTTARCFGDICIACRTLSGTSRCCWVNSEWIRCGMANWSRQSSSTATCVKRC